MLMPPDYIIHLPPLEPSKLISSPAFKFSRSPVSGTAAAQSVFSFKHSTKAPNMCPEYQCPKLSYSLQVTSICKDVRQSLASYPSSIFTFSSAVPWARKRGVRWKGKRILGDDGEGVGDEAEFGAMTDGVDRLGRSSSSLSHATACAGKSSSPPASPSCANGFSPLSICVGGSEMSAKCWRRGNQPHIPNAAAKGSPSHVSIEMSIAAQPWLRPPSATFFAPTSFTASAIRPWT